MERLVRVRTEVKKEDKEFLLGQSVRELRSVDEVVQAALGAQLHHQHLLLGARLTYQTPFSWCASNL